jgi:hypothetical protein
MKLKLFEYLLSSNSLTLSVLYRKIVVLWVIASCSFIFVYQRFRGKYYLHPQDILKIKAAIYSDS